MNANVSKADYQAALGKLVAEGKLSPEDAKQLMADYAKLKDLRDLSNTLDALQGNNASFDDYKNALQQAVDAGVITPEEAARLLSEYEASKRPSPTNILTTEDQTSPEFKQAAAQLNKYNANKGGEAPPLPKKPETFTAKQTEIKQQEDQDRQARLESIESAMQGQAGDLVNAWQAPQMLHMGSSNDTTNSGAGVAAGGRGVGAGAGANTAGKAGAIAASKVIIKGGTILFAVLDTGVNSDYKDSPVLATIVAGQYKGAKLMGKVTVSQGPVGQLDRVMLTFTKMTTDGWPESRNINAFAIDPDTARTMLASNVNYHYMQRFGAMFAGAFAQGFGQATLSSGGSSTQSSFGTSTTTPTMNTAKKLAVAVGQVGDVLQKATQGYADRPATVIVDSGVGLGILFMDDLS
jgi:type IV secretory pathway VirB10-like protein